MTDAPTPATDPDQPHRRNRLLAALPRAALARVLRHASVVPLERGRVLQESGEPVREALFPHHGIISLLEGTAEGRVAEAATIGVEGYLGFWAVLGDDSLALCRAVVQVPGEATRISLDALRAAIDEQPAVRNLLLRSTKIVLHQAFRTAVCNSLHPVEARCARWLLAMHDRQGGNGSVVEITQDYLALMAGVTRQTLSAAARHMQQEGLFRVEHGRVIILDRAGLEASACECYERMRGTIESVMGPACTDHVDEQDTPGGNVSPPELGQR